MSRARRRKRSFQKARDKVEKREEELHQGMAIRGIDNRERKKHKEEEKSKASSERSLDLASSTNFVDKSVPQDEKANRNSKDTTNIPEVFDSSKYDSMTEMKESADMKEEGHLKEVLSSVEKEEPSNLQQRILGLPIWTQIFPQLQRVLLPMQVRQTWKKGQPH
jgi:hypothetical protein